MSHPTTLYRLWSAGSELLYVGIAGNPGRRFEQHKADKAWWGDVERITLQHYPTRQDALTAELKAIKSERPRHNIASRSSTDNPGPMTASSATRPDAAGQYPLTTLWSYATQRSGYKRTTTLALRYELDGSSMSDDYYPDETDATKLWSDYVRQYGDRYHEDYPLIYKPGQVHIYWFLTTADGNGVFEFAPFQTLPPDQTWRNAERDNFLSYFSWPENTANEPLNFARLPVLDGRWTADYGDKGGFIQEATGWKPAPLQPVADLRQLARAAQLPYPTPRRRQVA